MRVTGQAFHQPVCRWAWQSGCWLPWHWDSWTECPYCYIWHRRCQAPPGAIKTWFAVSLKLGWSSRFWILFLHHLLGSANRPGHGGRQVWTPLARSALSGSVLEKQNAVTLGDHLPPAGVDLRQQVWLDAFVDIRLGSGGIDEAALVAEGMRILLLPYLAAFRFFMMELYKLRKVSICHLLVTAA